MVANASAFTICTHAARVTTAIVTTLSTAPSMRIGTTRCGRTGPWRRATAITTPTAKPFAIIDERP